MYRIIIYAIRISYIAISRIDKLHFSRWCAVKKRLNFFLNREIISWIASNSNNAKYSLNNQFILDSIIEVVFMHYQQRVMVYRLSRKFPCCNQKIFIQLSVLLLFFGLFSKLLREIVSMLYVYKRHLPANNELVNLSLNFPLHSFSFKHKKKSGNFYSFGEYLNANHSNITIFSIGEYIRHSEKIDNRSIDNDVLKFQRNRPGRTISPIIFLSKFIRVIARFIYKDNVKNKGIFLKLIYARKFTYKFNFMNMLGEIGLDYKDIETIFTLPFADVGLLKYDGKFFKKNVAFSYSQNALILPSPRIQEITNCTSIYEYMPLYALTLTEKVYGFSSLYSSVNSIKKKINKEFFLKLPISSLSLEIERPVMLGYEIANLSYPVEEGLLKQKFIAIFDLPPESEIHTMSRAMIGDRVCSYEFVEQFIFDTVATSISNGFSIIIKPKYSLSNYSDSYGALLSTMKEKYKDRFIVTDPYLSMDVIIDNSCGSISMPYTSAKLIFESEKIPSVYYVPSKYKNDFVDNYATDITYGSKNLEVFLNNL